MHGGSLFTLLNINNDGLGVIKASEFNAKRARTLIRAVGDISADQHLYANDRAFMGWLDSFECIINYLRGGEEKIAPRFTTNRSIRPCIGQITSC